MKFCAGHAFAIRTYLENNGSVEAAHRYLQCQFNLGHHDHVPSEHVINTLVHNLNETDSTLQKRTVGRPQTSSVHSPTLMPSQNKMEHWHLFFVCVCIHCRSSVVQ